MSEPIWNMSAIELAQAIASGQISARDAVSAHLQRIDEVNPAVNAVTVVLADTAMAEAADADERQASDSRLGPLHGVPFTIKDVFDLAGTATTMGVVGLKDTMPSRDTPVITKLKQAGAIPIARTNVPDFGVRWHTDNDLYGATLNPWDASRTPGGSSGGEAVAIATGMSPLGVGGDMGGSLRYPAQCCGIAALKPGFGLVSRTVTSIFDNPPMFYEQIAGVNGPMARRIADLRLPLGIMATPDMDDPCWTPAPVPDHDRPLRVAMVREPGGATCDPAIAEALDSAADALRDAGYEIETADPPALDETTGIIQQIADAETGYYLPGMLEMMSKASGIYLQTLIEDTRLDHETYMAAIAARHRIAAQWRTFMQDYPLVLGPVSTMQPFEVGYDIAGKPELKQFVRSLTLTEACNLLGLPSVAVPVQVNGGLPQGVQVIGGRFDEEMCLDAAEAIERCVGILTPIDPCISHGI